MRFAIFSVLTFFLGVKLVHAQESKELDAVFEQQLINTLLPAEQNVATGEYLLSVSKTDFQKAQAYFLIAQGQIQLGEIEKSIENLFLAKKNSEQVNNSFLSSYAEILLSRYCENFGMFDKAKSYLEDAKVRSGSISDRKQKSIVQSLIAEEEARGFLYQGHYSQAIGLFKQEEILAKRAKLPETFLINNRNLLGYCYLKEKQPNLAEICFTKNLNILTESDFPARCPMMYTFYGLACTALLQNNALWEKYLASANQSSVCKPKAEMLWVKEVSAILKAKDLQKQASDFEERLGALEVQDIENRRIGRSVMLSQMEKDRDSQAESGKMFNFKVILTLGFIIVLILSAYIYNAVKYKKEYRQFKKIMNESPAEKSTGENNDSPFPKIAVMGERSGELAMNEKTKDSILEKLKSFEASELYLSQDISLEKLSKYTDANSKYVREIIQKYKSKNYSSYINELRINYIINLLKSDPEYLKYKVSYLAQISGFSSHGAFSVVFKSITGLSPNQFIDFLRKDKQMKN